MSEIKRAIEEAVAYLSEHPEEARYTDSLASATLGGSLRVDVVGSNGEQIATDMPGAVGGRAEELSPGWLYRAAIASCIASTIGMEAARAELVLSSLDVDVDSQSDDRGILGIDESIPPGPISARVRIRATANETDRDELRQVIERGARRCPVFDATQRAVEMEIEIEG